MLYIVCVFYSFSCVVASDITKINDALLMKSTLGFSEATHTHETEMIPSGRWRTALYQKVRCKQPIVEERGSE